MNAVLEERLSEIQTDDREEYISHEEVVEVTRYLLEKHREAFIALANA